MSDARSRVYLQFPRDSDATRPCSTCVRSHAHAVSHASAGVTLPDHPDCTYDEGKPSSALCWPNTNFPALVPGNNGAQEPPKNRYEKLESRISEIGIALVLIRPTHYLSLADELESLLKDQGSLSNANSPPMGERSSTATLLNDSTSPSPASNNFGPTTGIRLDPATEIGVNYGEPPFSFSSHMDTFPSGPSPPNAINSSSIVGASASGSPSDQYGFDVFWPSWPRNLPLPNLLRHLYVPSSNSAVFHSPV